MQNVALHRPWAQVQVWELDTLAGAPWRHDGSGRMCNIHGYFSCALRRGAEWTPKWDCTGKGSRG